MQNIGEEKYIAQCCEEIASQLGWGDSALWTNQDFENLSEKIREATGVNLSITTLKRIWGKVKYDSAPAMTTLNTLAQFAGYEHWRAFRQQAQNSVPAELPSPQNKTTTRRTIWPWAAGILLVTGLLGFYFVKSRPSAAEIRAVPYQFSSRKVITEGVPNSVIFHYDAGRAPVDSIYIQQSWDPARRTKVPREQHQFTSVYYYPGFFKAKLVVGNEIVKEHDLFITTKGWLPMVEQQPVPVYFTEREALSGNELGLSLEKIREKNIAMQPQTPWVRYSNMGNWGDIHTDNFRFEANVRNDYREGSAVCQYIEIRLICDGSAIIIPLSNKGCVSELYMLFPGASISGKDTDLSMFGVDTGQWVKVVCEARNGQAEISLNGKPVFHHALAGKPLRIIGIDLRFQGTGRARDVKLERPES